ELIAPSISILAEPSVSVVDKMVDRHGTRAVAQAYLDFLYTEEGQRIAAKHYYRPRLPSVLGASESVFPKIALFSIDEVFVAWQKVHKTQLGDGGVFDQIYEGRK